MKGTASQGLSAEAEVKLDGMEKKTAWSVSDVWRNLKLFTSIEFKYQEVAS